MQRLTSSNEFLEWIEFSKMVEESQRTHPTYDHYYLAQIALECFNAFREKRKFEVDDFLLEFQEREEGESPKSKSNRRKPKKRSRKPRKKKEQPWTEERIQKSKNFWMAIGEHGAVRQLPDKVVQATKRAQEAKGGVPSSA